jgi:hypothetical protein
MRDAFAHIVSIDMSARKLVIERLYPDGRRELFTETALPDGKPSQEAVSEFALRLGENLLLDSPSARKLLGL